MGRSKIQCLKNWVTLFFGFNLFLYQAPCINNERSLTCLNYFEIRFCCFRLEYFGSNSINNKSTSDDEDDVCQDPSAEEAVGVSASDFKNAVKKAEVAGLLKVFFNQSHTLQLEEVLGLCRQLKLVFVFV